MAHTNGGDENEEYACNCGDVFDTLDELKAHARERHPEVYEDAD